MNPFRLAVDYEIRSNLIRRQYPHTVDWVAIIVKNVLTAVWLFVNQAPAPVHEIHLAKNSSHHFSPAISW